MICRMPLRWWALRLLFPEFVSLFPVPFASVLLFSQEVILLLCRPVDSSGDILPVLAPSDLLSGPAAASAGLRDYLNIFPGDWWESEDRGNPAFDLLSVSRRSDQDAQAMASALSGYLLRFPEVQSVSVTKAAFSDPVFSFACIVLLESGDSVPLFFSAP